MKKLLNFISFTHKLQQLERIPFVTGTERHESDADHSWQVGLVGWYLIQELNLSHNKDKVLAYSLIHDAVEAYAGDTFFYHKDSQSQLDKANREKKALAQIKKNFPEFKDLYTYIHSYERKTDPESRFVYALDKMMPMYNIFLDEGRTWKKVGVTLEMLATKRKKVAEAPELLPLFDELFEKLQKNKKKLFS